MLFSSLIEKDFCHFIYTFSSVSSFFWGGGGGGGGGVEGWGLRGGNNLVLFVVSLHHIIMQPRVALAL